MAQQTKIRVETKTPKQLSIYEKVRRVNATYKRIQHNKALLRGIDKFAEEAGEPVPEYRVNVVRKVKKDEEVLEKWLKNVNV